MGIRIIFEDEDIIRDVKDIQGAILIQNILEVLEIQFKKITIEQTEEDKLDIMGISEEELEKWR